MALDWLTGSADKTKQLPSFSPEQMSALQKVLGGLAPEMFNLRGNQLYGQGESYLQSLLGPKAESFGEFSKPYLQQYQQEILPMIGEQYAGQGSSSAFQNALGRSASGLQTGLAQIFEQLRGNAAGQASGYAQAPAQTQLPLFQLGLGASPFQYATQRGQTGLLGQLGAGAGEAFGGLGGIGAGKGLMGLLKLLGIG